MACSQRSPRGTGFGSKSTAAEVAREIRLDGKNAIVTGANSGLGKVTAAQLAKMGATVFVACRDPGRGKEAEEQLKRETGNQAIRFLKLDLSNLASVREGAAEFKKLKIPLHILVANAGVMATDYGLTGDGFETQFATNHLGHFLLTLLLLDELKAGAPSRLVVVSSDYHPKAPASFASVKKEEINSKEKYDRWAAYGTSKTSNILFVREFNRRYGSFGIFAYSLHPGVITTDLSRHVTGGALYRFFARPFTKTPEQGSATSVYLATAPEIESKNQAGLYWEDVNVANSSPLAADMNVAHDLWEKSLLWTGLASK